MIFRRTLAFVSVLALQACAGGATEMVASAPTPQPPAPAAPEPTPPPAPTTLATQPVGTTFTGPSGMGVEAYSWFNSVHPVPVTTTRLDGSVVVEKTTNGLVLRLPFSTATIDLSANSPQRKSEGNYSTVPSNGGTLTFLTGPNLSYSTYGVWKSDDPMTGHQSGQAGAIAYGIETQTLPTVGTAAFRGVASGVVFAWETEIIIPNGTVRLEADFARGTVTGLAYDLIASDATRFADIHFEGGQMTGNSFAGTTKMGTNSTRSLFNFANASGTFGGKFFGPGAREAAGSFTLSGTVYENRLSNKALFVGAFAATSDPNVTVTQPPPVAPHFPTLAEVHEYFGSGPKFSVSGSAEAPLMALENYRLDIITNETGFTLQESSEGRTKFDTSAGSPHTVAPHQYFATGTGSTGAPKSTHFLAGEALTYSTYGIWANVTVGSAPAPRPGLSPATTGGGVVAYGVQTTEATMPISGKGRYSGHLAGFFAVPGTFGTISDGDVQFEVDFASLTVAGTIRNITGVKGRTPNPTLAPERLNDIALSGVFRNGTATALATPGVTYDLQGASGTLSGQFYGPGAVEAGGSINMTGPGTMLQGAFAAKQ